MGCDVRRTLRLLLPWLLVGCVVNVLVGWFLATINRPEIFEERQVDIALEDWPMPPPTGWPPYVREVHSDYADSQFLLWGASRVGGAMEVGGVRYTMNARTAGTPWRCLAEAYCAEFTPPSTTKYQEIGRIGPFPVHPLWPGFALNTLFYTAIVWTLWHAPAYLRRRHRLKHNRCPRCGYDRTGLVSDAPCPECGRTQ